MLDLEDQINPDKIVRYLNIKATVMMESSGSPNPQQAAQEAYYQ
jgi:hypothetical protein